MSQGGETTKTKAKTNTKTKAKIYTIEKNWVAQGDGGRGVKEVETTKSIGSIGCC